MSSTVGNRGKSPVGLDYGLRAQKRFVSWWIYICAVFWNNMNYTTYIARMDAPMARCKGLPDLLIFHVYTVYVLYLYNSNRSPHAPLYFHFSVIKILYCVFFVCLFHPSLTAVEYYIYIINMYSDSGALLHLIKSSLGSGILAMPNAFKNGGLIFGLVGTAAIGALCTHCIYLLVSCMTKIILLSYCYYIFFQNQHVAPTLIKPYFYMKATVRIIRRLKSPESPFFWIVV